MANLRHKKLWSRLLLCAVIAGAALQGLGLVHSRAEQPANQALAQGPQVLLEEPSLSPAYEGMCNSGWYRFTTTLGYPAYLTPNIKAPAVGTNYGVWRPSLPQDGYYRIEAFIPAHGAVDWECPTLHIGWDTSDARYVISHAAGSSTIIWNQAPLNDEWISLGEFGFKAGTSGTVTLSDVTTEESFSKTVALSAMRFSWMRPLAPPTQTITNTVYLPTLITPGAPVGVQKSWTTDAGGGEKQAFTPSEKILYRMTGGNTTGKPAPVRMSWQQTGPCGPTTIFSGTLTIESGNWARQGSGSAPDCLGVYTTTLTLKYDRFTTTSVSNFVVNNPAVVAVSSQPAFDKCKVPSVEQMQAWWSGSPYRVANIYIGGSLLGCANTALDAFWLHAVSQQGWAFIPTWVGPQAPCTGFRQRMSADPATAYQQGRSEASAASDAATRLGLAGSQVIYYDVEGYQGASPACRNAVNYFLKGWVERMHELGGQAGAYGSSCNSYIAEWHDISPRPDNVWIASWVGTKYDPEASVWGAPCLPDSLWADQERIRQYAGDHRETWGGVSLTIDSNIVDGEINGLPVDFGLAQPFENYRPARQIHGFQSLPEGKGWVMVDDSLLWRHETGAWEEITPQDARLLSARFLDAASGWAASRDDLTGSLTVWRTADGGSSWASSPVQGVESLPSDIASAELMFLDSKTGWLVVKLQSSSSFSLGALFKTEDGGQSWKALTLPVAGVVLFTDEQNGQVTGGVSGEDVYLTEDGGLTWQRQVDETDQPAEAMSLAALPGQPEGTVTASLSGEGTAWALSQEGRCDGATLTPGEAELPGFRCELRTLLWESRDGGETWAPIELPPN